MKDTGNYSPDIAERVASAMSDTGRLLRELAIFFRQKQLPADTEVGQIAMRSSTRPFSKITRTKVEELTGPKPAWLIPAGGLFSEKFALDIEGTAWLPHTLRLGGWKRSNSVFVSSARESMFHPARMGGAFEFQEPIDFDNQDAAISAALEKADFSGQGGRNPLVINPSFPHAALDLRTGRKIDGDHSQFVTFTYKEGYGSPIGEPGTASCIFITTRFPDELDSFDDSFAKVLEKHVSSVAWNSL